MKKNNKIIFILMLFLMCYSVFGLFDKPIYIIEKNSINISNVSDLNNYYTKSQVYNQSEVDGLISSIPTPDLSSYMTLDQTTPQTTTGTFNFPRILVNNAPDNYADEVQIMGGISIYDYGTAPDSDYILKVHTDDDWPFLAGFYNDAWSPYYPVFEYFGWNYGGFTMGTNGGELILSISSWYGRNLVITPSGNTQINGNIENPYMPTYDPMDGTGTLWYDPGTNIVYRGT